MLFACLALSCGGNGGNRNGSSENNMVLSVTATAGGSVSIVPDQTSYVFGETVMLTAVADPGFRFSSWGDDLTGASNPVSIVMDANKTVTAIFDADTVPPQISNVQVTPDETSATITWKTNEPATSVVDYGEIATYELGTIEELTLVTDHRIVLSGLSADTVHHYQILSEDGYGNTGGIADAVFTTTAPRGGASGILSDDFNVCALDTGLWTLVDPVGDAAFAVAGSGSGDVQLEISVPAGTSHDPWSVNEAARLMQTAADTDFEIEVKFDSLVTQQYQEQGLIVEESSSNWLRFDVYSDGSQTMLLAASVVGGTPDTKINTTITTAAPVYLKVLRNGDVWDFSYSYDGVAWTLGTSFTHALSVSSVGPCAGNFGSGASAPAHTAVVDYFFNTADPIVPEDGTTLFSNALLSANTSGPGVVTIKPDQSTYICGETATLTAVPDAGYQFAGWSGDLTGTSNPASVVMNGDKTVTATFKVDDTPPVISNVQMVTGETMATITWQTDEPATSIVDYGETDTYELGAMEDLTLQSSHELVLTGLTDGQFYHYRITSVDGNGNASQTSDQTFTAGIPPGSPVIDIWYGNEQTFGQIGTPQQWVNILGNVSDSDGISSLTYSLNGGPTNTLSIGSDNARLENPGDINVEIAVSDLDDGANQVIIRAIDGVGNPVQKTVVVNYQNGNVWPSPYTIDWSAAGSIQDVAQVVDGHWRIENGMVRTVSSGYDRLIAIGDVTWSNYEVTVPIIVHSVTNDYLYTPIIGILAGWQGHTADGNQPSTQWWPLGAIGSYSFDPIPQLQLWLKYNKISETDAPLTLQLETEYIVKMRSERDSLDGIYSVKIWKATDLEPVGWDRVATESNDDQTTGSIVLLAHEVDASFGNVAIVPLP